MAAASSKTSPPELPGPPGAPAEITPAEIGLDEDQVRAQAGDTFSDGGLGTRVTEIMMITAATPMITPSMVNSERNLFFTNPFQAMEMTLFRCINPFFDC